MQDINAQQLRTNYLRGIGPVRNGNLMAAKKKKKANDACVRKVKRRYKKWPSAYASGAVAKCRKVGAKNWGNKSKKK